MNEFGDNPNSNNCSFFCMSFLLSLNFNSFFFTLSHESCIVNTNYSQRKTSMKSRFQIKEKCQKKTSYATEEPLSLKNICCAISLVAKYFNFYSRTAPIGGYLTAFLFEPFFVQSYICDQYAKYMQKEFRYFEYKRLNYHFFKQ